MTWNAFLRGPFNNYSAYTIISERFRALNLSERQNLANILSPSGFPWARARIPILSYLATMTPRQLHHQCINSAWARCDDAMIWSAVTTKYLLYHLCTIYASTGSSPQRDRHYPRWKVRLSRDAKPSPCQALSFRMQMRSSYSISRVVYCVTCKYQTSAICAHQMSWYISMTSSLLWEESKERWAIIQLEYRIPYDIKR